MPESAKDRLKKFVAAESEPELSDAEIDELLAASGLADAEGNPPQSEDWTPTYDLDRAAAEGWMLKAARAAGTTETDPETLKVTSRVFENCLRMRGLFSAMRAGRTRTTAHSGIR